MKQRIPPWSTTNDKKCILLIVKIAMLKVILPPPTKKPRGIGFKGNWVDISFKKTFLLYISCLDLTYTIEVYLCSGYFCYFLRFCLSVNILLFLLRIYLVFYIRIKQNSRRKIGSTFIQINSYFLFPGKIILI